MRSSVGYVKELEFLLYLGRKISATYGFKSRLGFYVGGGEKQQVIPKISCAVGANDQ
ncbi:hypothetical protein H4F44_24500 [Escherichia coli]|nr:hypothetical protein [Escherichia coli]